MASSSVQPSPTLYINNLNDKIAKDELKIQLHALFTTYGKIIDIVAQKGPRMRGQAFLVFSDLAGATSAMRACEGMIFYDKPLVCLDLKAKTKSYATSRREDPDFVQPTAPNASKMLSQTQKRPRDEAGDVGRVAKREKSEEEEDEEMEIDDEDESSSAPKAIPKFSSDAVPPSVEHPSARLLCTNLPQEVNDGVLSVLFQQYKGFQLTQVVWSPTPNAAGERVKMASVIFESAELATVAREALNGFILKKDWPMTVAYM